MCLFPSSILAQYDLYYRKTSLVFVFAHLDVIYKNFSKQFDRYLFIYCVTHSILIKDLHTVKFRLD